LTEESKSTFVKIILPKKLIQKIIYINMSKRKRPIKHKRKSYIKKDGTKVNATIVNPYVIQKKMDKIQRRILNECPEYNHQSYNADRGYGTCKKYGVPCFQIGSERCKLKSQFIKDEIKRLGGIPERTEKKQKPCGHYIDEICDCEVD